MTILDSLLKVFFPFFSLPDGLDGLQDVEGLADVPVLGLEELGQPPALVGEPHVQHGLNIRWIIID